jgi:hypothetical protein
MTMRGNSRMLRNKYILFISVMLLLWTQQALPQTIGWQGQLSGWVTVNPGQSFQTQIGLRYIPDLSIEKTISEKYALNSEISLNSFGSSLLHSFDDIDTAGKLKPYRIWLRFSSSQFEVRAGLQKINFGSATLLRPLMWFDRIDPRDPLQITDGVYGLLGRYYFLNNASIWLWGLYGNDETKGWEVIPSDKNSLEYGGRVQVPLFTGEIAATYHHREADLQNQMFANPVSSKHLIPEDRIGLDGKLDIGIGLWFEGVLIHRDIDISLLRYQRLYNFGVDYTFGLGNGLHVMSEYFTLETSDKALSGGDGISFSAVSLNYPLGLFDNLTGMIYFDWEHENWYRFVNFQRTFDNWSFYVIGFWNPDQFQIYQNQPEQNLYAGKGLQLMVVFNH